MNNPAHQPPKRQSRAPVASSVVSSTKTKKKKEGREKKIEKKLQRREERRISDERCERVDRLISRGWKKVDDRVTGGKGGNALIGQRLRTHIDLRRWLLERLRGWPRVGHRLKPVQKMHNICSRLGRILLISAVFCVGSFSDQFSFLSFLLSSSFVLIVNVVSQVSAPRMRKDWCETCSEVTTNSLDPCRT